MSSEDHRKLAQSIFDSVPFLAWIGLEVEEASADRVTASFRSREDLIGNPHPHILHGGIISSVMDSVGGLVGILNYLDGVRRNESEEAYNEALQRTNRLATIDMRSDFLLPGRGNTFSCEGRILRLGRHVVVARMELRNEEGELIAVGTGTYNY